MADAPFGMSHAPLSVERSKRMDECAPRAKPQHRSNRAAREERPGERRRAQDVGPLPSKLDVSQADQPDLRRDSARRSLRKSHNAILYGRQYNLWQYFGPHANRSSLRPRPGGRVLTSLPTPHHPVGITVA